MKILTFRVADREYGVDIGQVREVIRMPACTPIPDLPFWVEGIMDLRGEVVAVINLRRKLSLDDGQRAALDRVIVIHRSGGSLGVVVDGVTGVINLGVRDIAPPDDLLRQAGYIAAVARVGQRLVPLMNLQAILSDPEAAFLAEAQPAALDDGSAEPDAVPSYDEPR